jgi:hypothetical protein
MVSTELAADNDAGEHGTSFHDSAINVTSVLGATATGDGVHTIAQPKSSPRHRPHPQPQLHPCCGHDIHRTLHCTDNNDGEHGTPLTLAPMPNS